MSRFTTTNRFIKKFCVFFSCAFFLGCYDSGEIGVEFPLDSNGKPSDDFLKLQRHISKKKVDYLYKKDRNKTYAEAIHEEFKLRKKTGILIAHGYLEDKIKENRKSNTNPKGETRVLASGSVSDFFKVKVEDLAKKVNFLSGGKADIKTFNAYDTEKFSLDKQVEEIMKDENFKAMLDDPTYENIVLCGWSYGGLASLEAAKKLMNAPEYADKIRGKKISLVTIASPLRGFESDVKKIFDLLNAIKDLSSIAKKKFGEENNPMLNAIKNYFEGIKKLYIMDPCSYTSLENFVNLQVISGKEIDSTHLLEDEEKKCRENEILAEINSNKNENNKINQSSPTLEEEIYNFALQGQPGSMEMLKKLRDERNKDLPNIPILNIVARIDIEVSVKGYMKHFFYQNMENLKEITKEKCKDENGNLINSKFEKALENELKTPIKRASLNTMCYQFIENGKFNKFFNDKKVEKQIQKIANIYNHLLCGADAAEGSDGLIPCVEPDVVIGETKYVYGSHYEALNLDRTWYEILQFAKKIEGEC